MKCQFYFFSYVDAILVVCRCIQRSFLISNSNSPVYGISDYHKMIFSILKHNLAKGPSKTICYRDLKNLDQKAFNGYLEFKMTACPDSFEKFLQIFQDAVQLFAPLKKKIIRYNNKMFTTKSLRKAIMTHSKLQNKYIKNRTPKTWTIFKKTKKQMCKNSKECKKGISQ